MDGQTRAKWLPGQRRYIDTWHVCIGGFSQSEGSPTGLFKLWLRLGALFRDATTCVVLREWNANWSKVAEQIHLAANGTPPRIFIHAYSWGAGWGFVRLATELRKRGLDVTGACLSDPVYRHGWRCLSWLAFSPLRRILVPDNVRDVRWFFQRSNYPRGHQVIARDPKQTVVHKGRELKANHEWMDDLQEFHNASLTMAGEHVQ